MKLSAIFIKVPFRQLFSHFEDLSVQTNVVNQMPFVVVPLAISLLKAYKDNPILSHRVPHPALSFLFIKFSMRSPLQAIPNMPTSVQKSSYHRILFSTVSTPLIPHTRRFPSPRPTPRAWWCIVLFWFTAPSLNYYHPRRRRSPP